jgi:hypothetical protein
LKLTELKGCGKSLVTVVEHSMVYWDRGPMKAVPFVGPLRGGAYRHSRYVPTGPKQMKACKAAVNTRKRNCGDYRKGWGCCVYLCDACIIKNGLKW